MTGDPELLDLHRRDRMVDEIRASAHQRESMLMDLVRIPSVSGPTQDMATLRRCAEAVASMAVQVGLAGVRLLEVDGAAPYVYGEWLEARDAPTVLLYSHYDVQPTGNRHQWSSDPFEPVVRSGRLYGRGACDDKAGVVLHLAAIGAWLRAWGRLPANVRLLVEGEEEFGSRHVADFLKQEADRLACDGVIVADSTNLADGVPAVTRSVRGTMSLTITLRTARSALHSGLWGGVVPDPILAMSIVLAGLVDANGCIAAPGFEHDHGASHDDLRPAAFYTDAGIRGSAGLLDDVRLIGDPGLSLEERLWSHSSLVVRGIDAPAVDEAPNVIQPVARARLNVRLGPGQDPTRASRLLTSRIEQLVPWGVECNVEPGPSHRAWSTSSDGRLVQAVLRSLQTAFEVEPAVVGIGASVPFVSAFASQFPAAEIVLTGVEDPDSRAHGPDESLNLSDWHQACLGEALLIAEVGRSLDEAATMQGDPDAAID